MPYLTNIITFDVMDADRKNVIATINLPHPPRKGDHVTVGKDNKLYVTIYILWRPWNVVKGHYGEPELKNAPTPMLVVRKL
jgi:hypothetical protein